MTNRATELPGTDAEVRKVALAICKSRTCEGGSCCQWPANMGRTNCNAKNGAYDDAARAAIAARTPPPEAEAVRHAWAVLRSDGRPDIHSIWTREPGPAIRAAHERMNIKIAPIEMRVLTPASQGSEAGEEWHDVSTAPKDGTKFIAYWPPFVRGGADAMDIVVWADGGWRDPDDLEALYGDFDAWRPLPLPPATGRETEGKGE